MKGHLKLTNIVADMLSNHESMKSRRNNLYRENNKHAQGISLKQNKKKKDKRETVQSPMSRRIISVYKFDYFIYSAISHNIRNASRLNLLFVSFLTCIDTLNLIWRVLVFFFVFFLKKTKLSVTISW